MLHDSRKIRLENTSFLKLTLVFFVSRFSRKSWATWAALGHTLENWGLFLTELGPPRSDDSDGLFRSPVQPQLGSQMCHRGCVCRPYMYVCICICMYVRTYTYCIHIVYILYTHCIYIYINYLHTNIIHILLWPGCPMVLKNPWFLGCTSKHGSIPRCSMQQSNERWFHHLRHTQMIDRGQLNSSLSQKK